MLDECPRVLGTIGSRRPVSWPQRGISAVCNFVQRLDVRRHRPIWGRNNRRAPTHDVVTGEQAR